MRKCPICSTRRFNVKRTVSNELINLYEDIPDYGKRTGMEVYCASCGSRLELKNGELIPFRGYYNVKDGGWKFSDEIDPTSDLATQSRYEMLEYLKKHHKICETQLFNRR